MVLQYFLSNLFSFCRGNIVKVGGYHYTQSLENYKNKNNGYLNNPNVTVKHKMEFNYAKTNTLS